MPQFISKLQYKTCEKGEYYDEKPRNLEETIELINNFPWAREQYADVELTGPSITILDDKGNYLKVGIYFGGRFTLYYLDTKYHLYKRSAIDLDMVYRKVTEFFSGQIDLQKFEKHSFAVVKKFFITKQFEYRISIWKMLLLSIVWIYLFIIFSVIFIASVFIIQSLIAVIVTSIGVIGIGSVLIYIFEKYYHKRKQYLKISRGNPEFLFGDSQDEIKSYRKEDISKIIRYRKKATNDPNMFVIFEIDFIAGSNITFSNMLIGDFEFSSKFSDKWNVDPVLAYGNTLKML